VEFEKDLEEWNKLREEEEKAEEDKK